MQIEKETSQLWDILEVLIGVLYCWNTQVVFYPKLSVETGSKPVSNVPMYFLEFFSNQYN